MTAANYPNCLAFTLKYEGGYVNNPKDPGGPTNLGVTIATLSQELGRAATIAEVRALTPATVGPIYKKRFWNVVGGDNLPAGVDLMAFDIAVNMGPGRVLPWLAQTATLAPIARIKALDGLRMGFWKRLGSWVTFGRGWTSREQAALLTALTMQRRVSA